MRSFMKVKCPRCGKETEFNETNPTRPFCGERCQTIDLGAWADEQYRVPDAQSDPDSVNENSEEVGDDDRDSPLKH